MAGVGSEVYVKLASGQIVTLNVSPTDTVRSLSTQVVSNANLPAKTQVQLKYQGKVLKATHTVKYLGIRIETILKAQVIEPKSWTVHVRMPDGMLTPVQVENVSPVRLVLSRLDPAADPYVGHAKLKLGSRMLTDLDETLIDAGLMDGGVLELNKKATTDDDENTGPDLEALVGTFEAGSRPVDVVFSFDTTGSMYSCLSEVRTKLREACDRLLTDISQLRIGIIAHGDYTDQDLYVVRQVDLTRDVDSLVNFVRDVPETSGGDAPECYEWVLRKAQMMDWAEDSAKALIIIGDAEPHSINFTDQRINWHDELDVLRGMGIKVYGVQAMNSSSSTPFYAELAERTGGAHIKFNNFQVITDMFLAVCYREADGGAEGEGNQLAAFMDELQQDGRLEGDVGDIMQQVAQEAHVDQEPLQQNRYVDAAWWDPNLDNNTPQYNYDSTTDTWNPARVSSSINTTPDSRSRVRKSSRWNKLKRSGTKKCSVM